MLTNLRLKVLAIALAVAFWGGVAYTQNPTQSPKYLLSVDPLSLPSGLTIVGDLPQVMVTILGTAESLHGFDSRSLHLSGNFANVHVGLNRVPLHLGSTNPDVTVNQPDPITVQVDALATTAATVSIERVHNLPSGFHEVTALTTVTPTSVQVQGPKSLLTGIQAVVRVDMDGVVAPFEQPYSVVIRDAKRSPLKGMTVSPAQVAVKMTIQADAVTETKAIGVRVTGQPAAGYLVTNIQATPLSVNATGLAATLAGLLQIPTDPVDISNASSDVVRTVRLRPPAGVDVSPTTIQVHVFIVKIVTPST